MPVVSETVIKYAARGAEQVQRKDRQVRESIKETARTARKETGTIRQWMEQHQTALMAIGAATLTAIGMIVRNSPTLQAHLSSVRLAFSLLAMEIGQSLAPVLRGVGDILLRFAEWFGNLPQPVKDFTAAILVLLPLLTAVGVAIANSGAVVATVAGLISGPLIAAILGVTAVVAALYVAWRTDFLGIRTLTKKGIKKITSFIKGFVGWLEPYWNRFLGAVLEGRWGDAWAAVKSAALDAVARIVRTVTTLTIRLNAAISKAKATIRTGFELAWSLAINETKQGLNTLIGIVERRVNDIIGAINTVPGLNFGNVSLGRLQTKSADQLVANARSRLGQRFNAINRREQRQLQQVNITIEAGAIQMGGGGGAEGRANTRDLAEGISAELAEQLRRR